MAINFDHTTNTIFATGGGIVNVTNIGISEVGSISFSDNSGDTQVWFIEEDSSSPTDDLIFDYNSVEKIRITTDGDIQLAGSLLDSNSNIILDLSLKASAVNYISICNASTGSRPVIKSVGSDTDVDLLLSPQNSGNLILDIFTWPNTDGTNGQVVTTDGSGNLSFSTVSGTGTVTSVATGVGLTGGPITVTGTIDLDIDGLTLETTLGSADTVAFYDDSAGSHRKTTLSDLSTFFGSASSLNALSDVTVPTPIVADYLRYSSGMWRNEQLTIVNDTSPVLGGNLDVNGFEIVSSSNGDVFITSDGAGTIVLNGLVWPTTDGMTGQALITDGSGNLSFTTISGTDDQTAAEVPFTPAGTLSSTNVQAAIEELDSTVLMKLETVEDDTIPTLGGDLDVNGNSIISVSNGNIPITPDGSGNVILDGLIWPSVDGTSGQVLTTDGSGNLSFTTSAGGGLADVVDDTSPQLGGNLDVNGFSIISVSNGDIAISPDGTGEVIVGTSGNAVIISDDNNNMTIGGGNSDGTDDAGDTIITSGNGTTSFSSGDVYITPGVGGSVDGSVIIDGLIWPSTDGTVGQLLKTDGSGNLGFTGVNTELYEGFLHVRDEQTSGTDGGSSTSGSWEARVLNTTLTNTISGASLSSNQITLPAGIYEIEANAPAFQSDAHKIKLRDTTNTVDLVIGSSAHSRNGVNGDGTHSFVKGRFTLSGTVDLELQHQVATSQAINGYGVASSFGVVEVYAEVIIRKIVQ